MNIFDPVFTGSIQFLSPVSSGGITGSLFGTASWATNVVNAGGLSGGQDKYIARWNGTNSITTSSIYEGTNKNVAINTTAFDGTYPQALLVSGSTLNIISGEAKIDSYAQLNIINRSGTSLASSDIVATNDAASETGNFVDLGINSSNYGGTIGSNNEAYLYNTGSNFLIGNTTRGDNANLKFFAGNDAAIFPLIVTGSNIIATGSLQGSSSYATSASYAANGGVTQIVAGTNITISPTNGLGAVTINSTGGTGAAFPYTGSAQITGSLGITGSTSLIGTFRFNEALDPGGATTNAVFLFASRSEDGVDTDWYYRHSGNLWNYDWFENIVDTGIIYGGIVTFTGSAGVDTPPNATQIRVTPGLGLYVNHNATTSSKGETVATLVPFGPFTQSFTSYITSSQAAYLYVDNTGNLNWQSTIFTTDQYHQAFPLGVFFSLTTSSIASWGDLRVTNYGQQQQAGEFIRAFGPLKVNGYDITAQSGSLRISVASGKAFRFGGFYTQDPDSPSVYDSSAVPTASLVRVYQDPSAIGGFKATTNAGVPYTTIDPTKWDDGTGTLKTVGSGEFTIQRVFQGVVNNVSYIYYGQNKYASLAAAIQNVTTENFNESQTSIVNLPFIGYVIAEGTATNLADTGSTRIINAGLFRNTAGSSGGGGASVTALNDLSDVTITTPVEGEALVYQSGIWVNSDPKTASTASYINNLNQNLSVTGSVTISGSSTAVELRVAGQTHFSGSVIMSASSAEKELTIIGDTVITGSLIVSGSGGYGVFSKGVTLADLTNGFTVTGSYFVWRSPYPATVVGLWAIKSGSASVSVNARRSGSGTALHTGSNLTVTANNVWTSVNSVTNSFYSSGDSLEIIFSGSNILQSSVQVDYIKR